MRGSWVCDVCAPQVPALNGGICDRCGGPETGHQCRGCPALDARITQARACYPYTGWVAGAVQRLKYQGEWSRADQFAPVLAELVRAFQPVDLLVPVPLHPARFDARGFNQADDLARRVAAITGIPWAALLERTRNTQTQVAQNRLDRIQNVKGAFAVRRDAVIKPNCQIVLIDDVRTSGATVNACAAMLAVAQPTATIRVATVALDLPSSQLHAWLSSHADSARSRPAS